MTKEPFIRWTAAKGGTIEWHNGAWHVRGRRKLVVGKLAIEWLGRRGLAFEWLSKGVGA